MTLISCLQIRAQPTFESALQELLPLAQQAVDTGAKFICLPEYCGGIKSQGAILNPPAENENEHPVLGQLLDFAKVNQTWILIGSIAIKEPGGKILNRSYVVDASGRIVSRYDKIHLFDVQLSKSIQYKESTVVTPGNNAVLVDTLIGKLGLSICYDIRFPELYRTLAQSGAEVLAIPAAFTKITGQAHWHVLNRARAIENCAYVVSPCTVGSVPGGGECFGHSLIIDPWGTIIADGGDKTGIINAKIELDLVLGSRQRIPSLNHDRSYTLNVYRHGSNA